MVARFLVPLGLTLFLPTSLSLGATPSVTMTAYGEMRLAYPAKSYLLEWSSSNASSCTISHRVNGRQVIRTVAPNMSARQRSWLIGSYTLRCLGSDGQSAS